MTEPCTETKTRKKTKTVPVMTDENMEAVR